MQLHYSGLDSCSIAIASIQVWIPAQSQLHLFRFGFLLKFNCIYSGLDSCSIAIASIQVRFLLNRNCIYSGWIPAQMQLHLFRLDSCSSAIPFTQVNRGNSTPVLQSRFALRNHQTFSLPFRKFEHKSLALRMVLNINRSLIMTPTRLCQTRMRIWRSKGIAHFL